MDILNDYTSETIQLKPDYEGEVIATLVKSKHNIGNRRSVLYLHGYVDYFFQEHLGQKFIENNFDFYALDLRKYGRSLLPHQHPNYCRDISEYYEEISIAIEQIHNNSNGEVYLLGHSTGGLIASNYMNYGGKRCLIKGLILNSPFLDFNQSELKKLSVYLLSKPMARLFPYSKTEGALSPVNAQCIHKDFHGEWDFSLDWKPIEGFPTYFAWILAIREAHKNLLKSNIVVPILVMHSSGSGLFSNYSEEATKMDTVLDIKDIKRVGAQLGSRVTMLEVKDALHDIFLSAKEVREKAFKEMFEWINDISYKEFM